MWNGYCGDLIRAINRRRLLLVIAGAAIILLFLAYHRAYFRGFFGGPHVASQTELLNATDSKAFPNAILTVAGGETTGTGLVERRKDDAHPNGYISARYLATLIGGKKLLVRVAPDTPLALDAAATPPVEETSSFTGQVLSLSNRMTALVQPGGPAQPAYLPYVLDTYDYKAWGWTSIVFGGIALIFILWGAFLYLRSNSDPAQDPFARGLAKVGPLESVVPQLDAEMAAAHTTFTRRNNSVHIGQQWMVVATPFRAHGARVRELIWLYRQITKKRIYFVIPAGTRHTLIMHDRTGRKLAVELGDAKCGEVLQLLRSVAPQAVYGYDKRLAKLWRSGTGTDRAAFVTEAQALLGGQALPESVTRRQFSGV